MKIYRTITAVICVACICGCTPKLSKDDASKAVKKIMPGNFEIVSLRPLKELSGISEVVVKIGKQVMVVYLDNKGKYIVSGNVISADTQRNLTLETQKKFTDQ